MPNLWELTAQETVEKLRGGEVTAEECILSIFERIKGIEGKVHAFLTLVEEERALERAREIDEKVAKGRPLGRLAGVAVAVKDNICTRGIRTTCASHMLENFIPPYDATVIEKIKKEDAIILGKTNMDEFAMGSSTETSYFGPTHNPWDPSTVPGGSSGGSAAAVAADECVLAFGSDTGGSIRCPASFCSVVGLKPTYGLVSRYGLIAYANSLEQIGPIAKNVYDCALFLSVMAGHDPRDATSVEAPSQDYTSFLKNNIQGLKVGVPREFFGEGTSQDVEKCLLGAIHKLEELGASCQETSLPTLEHALPAYYVIAMSEASSNLARYDGLRYGYQTEDATDSDWSTVYSRDRRMGFGAEVRRRIILGTYALSAGYYNRYYLKALRIRTLIRRDFEASFKKFDVLVGPTMPTPPFKIGEKIQDPLSLYMCDILTVPANLAGLPAISIPCGFCGALPIGMQITAPPFREDLILRVGYTFEQNTTHKDRKPPLR
ncbi:MAG: Asp-tRNA(Asn)/Glu-tRNA(Gln) amidotransferase subunit GatA [Candidatus Bathyarchaeia archaeon]